MVSFEDWSVVKFPPPDSPVLADSVIVASFAAAPPEAAIVIVSVVAFVVSVIFDPSANVSVSVFESATILFCPETAIVLNIPSAVVVEPPPPETLNFSPP